MAKYSTELVGEIGSWIAEHGLMDYGGARLKELCSAFGISDNTYYQWLGKDEFREAVDRGKQSFKESLNRDLVTSLAMSAKGFDYTKTKEHKEFYPRKDGKKGHPIKVVEDVERGFTPPNVGAAIFLLTNLAPEQWQNRQRSDVLVRKDEERTMTLDEINEEIERLTKLSD